MVNYPGQLSAKKLLLTEELDDNKTKIAKSGALVPLTRLARSKDMRVQRNATGALLNMTHSGREFSCRSSNAYLIFVQTRTDNNLSMPVPSLFSSAF